MSTIVKFLFAFLVSLFILAVAGLITDTQTSYRLFPYYNQCYHDWGSDKMGLKSCSVSTCEGGRVGRDTICSEGCAMSCVSMALSANCYEIGGDIPTPKILNAWLVSNSGYECLDGNCNNMVLKQVERIASGSIDFLGEISSGAFNWTNLIEKIDQGLVVIAHVRDKTHFVLVTGYSNGSHDAFTVLDPFYHSTVYKASEISDVILYNMKQQNCVKK